MRKIIFFLFLPFFARAQKNYENLLDQYMQAQMNVKGFSGVVLVAKGNRVLLKKGYGLANREWNIPNTVETKFRIGSLTKQFTATAILQLVEEKKLSLDDKLSKFFPRFPKGDSVTIHMLLNHTSGIASYTNTKEFARLARLSWPRDSIVDYIMQRPYDFSPGTKWQYNNSGYFLLGCIIEQLSGQPYSSYIATRIFDPLHMNHSGVDRPDSILPFRASGYNFFSGKESNADFTAMQWPFSAGAVYSTVEDLYAWDRSLYTHSILSETLKQKMFTPEKNNYGYALFIDSLEGHPRMWHSGSIAGFQSFFSRFVKDDVCVIVLSNNFITLSNMLSIVSVVADGLSSIALDLPVEIPYVHKEVKIDPSLLDKFVGKYNAFLTLEVIRKDGKLYRHRDGSPDIELKPESPTKFFYADNSDRQLEFELDKQGNIARIWFINNEQRGEMKRIGENR